MLPFLFLSNMNKAARLVSAAITRMDFVTVIVAGKSYAIYPPTIHKLSGAGMYLSDMDESDSVAGVIKSINNADKLAHALSWLIKGDESLFKELMDGTIDELVDAIGVAYSLISVENFIKLSTLVRNVSKTIAKPK